MGNQRELPYPSFSFYMRCLRPRHISPKREVRSINDISSEELRQMGIRGIVFDVENTLGKYKCLYADERVEGSFRRLTQDFRCCMLSNTSPERLSQLEKNFGIPAIRTNVRKPMPEAFIQATNYLGIAPANTAMIGDRLLSDIAGANMAGLLTIKVSPLQMTSEPFAHALARAFESFVYGFYKE